MEHKTALVTGATSNIGRAIATAFAAEGVHLVVSGRSPQRGAEVIEQIRACGGRAEFIAANLDGSAKASRALAADATRALGGRIDVLVNNAGIYPGASTPATDEATFDEVYAVNVKAPFFLTAAIAPAMVEYGSGAIINLGSWIARLGIPIGSLYSSTKGAIETARHCDRRAWGGRITPGEMALTRTPPGPKEHPAEAMMRRTPAGHSGTPDAIAHAAVYLASDEASFVHGTIIDVDGGRVGVAVIAAG